MLPKAVWLDILSFTTRGWFAPPASRADKLAIRLEVEREARLAAEAVSLFGGT